MIQHHHQLFLTCHRLWNLELLYATLPFTYSSPTIPAFVKTYFELLFCGMSKLVEKVLHLPPGYIYSHQP